MISRITKILFILQAFVAIALSLALHLYLDISIAIACILGMASVIVFRMLITANNFFMSYLNKSDTPPEHRINIFQGLRLYFSEFKATMMTSSWMMPFRTLEKYHAKKSDQLPVLLVHGYASNSGQWYPLSQRLKSENITHHALDMEPPFDQLDTYIPFVQKSIAMLCEQSKCEKVVIVTHSMGGLVMRAYLRKHGGARIAKIITLGTPHHGTALAKFGKGLNCVQMQWNGKVQPGSPSEWLQQLASEENPDHRQLIVSMYSHHDNIIAPQSSSYLSGAKNLAFHGIGHVALLFNRNVQDQIVEEIKNTLKIHN
jgi:triacylglycerol lipase